MRGNNYPFDVIGNLPLEVEFRSEYWSVYVMCRSLCKYSEHIFVIFYNFSIKTRRPFSLMYCSSFENCEGNTRCSLAFNSSI